MFLYILKLPKYNCIKIGVAKSHTRIKQHINTYGEIDLDESYIVHAISGDTIRQLEKQLLEDYIDYKIEDVKLMSKDGYTELRSKDILLDIVEDIKYKSNKFGNKGITIKKGIYIKEEVISKIEKTKVPKGIEKSKPKNDILKNMFIKNNYLFEGCNYYIPEQLVYYPMFRIESGNKSIFEYKFQNISIVCQNDKSNRIPNQFDFGVLLSIIQIYLEGKKISDLSQINEIDNKVGISFYKICTILEVPSTGYYVQRVKESIDILSDTEIIIDAKKSNNKVVLISKLYSNSRDKDKNITISIDLLSELKLNKVVIINKSIFNNSPSPYTQRIYCLINYLIKETGVLEISIEDFESVIGSDLAPYMSTRKIIKAFNYLVESEVINSYSIENRRIEIIK